MLFIRGRGRSGLVGTSPTRLWVLDALDDDPVGVPILVRLRGPLHPHPHLYPLHPMVDGVRQSDVEVALLDAFTKEALQLFSEIRRGDLFEEVLPEHLGRVALGCEVPFLGGAPQRAG